MRSLPFSSTLVDVAVPRRRRKDARPAELLAAALELFVEKDFAATRLTDVAARAGVAKGTLYLYFDSKEALFRAVVEQGIVPLFAAAEHEMDSYEGGSAELLCHFLTLWWQQIGATRLADVLRRGIASGEFRDLDVDSTINVVIAPLLMLIVWRFSLSACGPDEIEPEQLLKTHFDLLVHGLCVQQRKP